MNDRLSDPVAEIFADLLARHTALESCRSDLFGAFQMLRDCFSKGGKLLICGNGGSAADADHIAAELLKGFRCPRRLRDGQLPAEISQFLQGALPAIPLPQLVAIQTAFANDCRPEFAFAQLVFALGRPGDILLSLSTSGNSANVLHANGVARAMGMGTVGLSGAGGGRMRETCDRCIRVPATETYLVQELHLPVYHALCAALEAHFFKICI
jgi:D-sedoheptulose 7-phosphate isomerase